MTRTHQSVGPLASQASIEGPQALHSKPADTQEVQMSQGRCGGIRRGSVPSADEGNVAAGQSAANTHVLAPSSDLSRKV